MKIETIDPYAAFRDREQVIFNRAPRTRATLSMSPTQAMAVGWRLFWRSLWSVVRRHRSIDFWLEDGS